MRASSTPCQPMTILATICDDMPGMSGCSTYNVMCGDKSIIQQCQQEGAIARWGWEQATVRGGLAACARLAHVCLWMRACTGAAARVQMQQYAYTLPAHVRLCA